MEDSVTFEASLAALATDPRVASVEFVSFDYGASIGVQVKTRDGRVHGSRLPTMSDSVNALKGWLDNG